MSKFSMAFFLRTFLTALALVSIGSCNVANQDWDIIAPFEIEQELLSGGERTILLARFVLVIDGVEESFKTENSIDRVPVFFGGFESAGGMFWQPNYRPTASSLNTFMNSFSVEGRRYYATQRHFSETSKYDGWVYMIVPRNSVYWGFLPRSEISRDYFFAVNSVPNLNVQSGEKLRLNIPCEAEAIYVGTIRVHSRINEGGVFGRSSRQEMVSEIESIQVVDESERAISLLNEHLPNLSVETILLSSHHGPPVIDTCQT